jgi:hypothetical protein
MSVACPLEGLVRSVASRQKSIADLGFTSSLYHLFVVLTPSCQHKEIVAEQHAVCVTKR